jgi:DNA-binding CsgD family transcriptional regulator
MGVDLVGILEAAYRVEQDETSWLRGVVEAARPGLDKGLGVTALLYDASDVSRFRVWSIVGTEEERGPRMASAMEASSPKRVTWTFRTQACRTASEGPDWDRQPARALFRQWGIEDVFFANGLDPSGIGCFLTAALPAKKRIGPRERVVWERVAAHLAAGYRLLRGKRASKAEVEAVLDPNGRVHDAAPAAKAPGVRARLRDAVVAMDRARAKRHRSDPDRGLAEWTALTDARWSLVDSFETDGRRFVVARKNDVEIPRPEALAPRERQVLGYAALGHSNKFIAYELGISPSTVAVLLSRAARKLRVRSRAALIEAFLANDPSRPRT